MTKSKKEYKINKKRSGRYEVISKGKNVNGEEKVKILLKEGLIKVTAPKSPAAEEAPAEETAES